MLHDMTLAELDAKRREKQAKLSELQTVCIADVEPKAINWLWPEKIARGKVSMIAGDPGLGKSLITIALASAVSTGARWPVGGGNAPLGSVTMLSDEDSVADTIRPRLDAAGADCTKIHALKMVREINKNGEIVERSFSLAKDIERLAEVLEKLGDCVLVQIDPISAYLGGTDSHNNADVRALLSPLSELAERFNVAIVAVTHLNKGSGNAIYRATGSLAFVAAARSVLGVTKDPDDPNRRLVLPMKNNLGNDTTGMAYQIDTAENGAPVVMWEPEPVDIDINIVLNGESNDYRSERNDAIDWLTSELSGGPVPAKDLIKRARDAGHSWSTVKRAKSELGVKSRKTGMKDGWEWWHPDDIFTPPYEEDHEGVEDAQSLNVGPFGEGWSPSGDAPKSGPSAKDAHEDAQGAQSPGMSAFDPFGTLSGNGATENSDEEAHI